MIAENQETGDGGEDVPAHGHLAVKVPSAQRQVVMTTDIEGDIHSTIEDTVLLIEIDTMTDVPEIEGLNQGVLKVGLNNNAIKDLIESKMCRRKNLISLEVW